MAETSTIEWTNATWNPVTGCDRVSPGCANCYALQLAARLKAMGSPHYQRDGDPKTSGPGFGVSTHEDALGTPLRWRKPRMVFVNSMSDLFHEEIPDAFVAAVFSVMGEAGRHTFQVLTKRPERAREWFSRVARCEHGWLTHNGENPTSYGGTGIVLHEPWPLPNVWLGVSIENARYTWRADVLREIPAAVRFLSCEPLLGSLYPSTTGPISGESPDAEDAPRQPDGGSIPPGSTRRPLDLTGIDWVIAGGESGGRKSRPMHPEWAREIRDACLHEPECAPPPGELCDCDRSRPAFFFKQWGSWGPSARESPRTLYVAHDGAKTDDPWNDPGFAAERENPGERWKSLARMSYLGVAPKSGGNLLDGREWKEFPPSKVETREPERSAA